MAPHLTGESADTRRASIGLEEAGDSPILREYRGVKAEYPDALILTRLGDFFELFDEHATIAAPILEVTLTGRGFGAAGRIPMCGIPHHAMPMYARRLLDHGHRVVIWDQVGEAVPGKLVRREVTRVLTPGTIVEEGLADEQRIVMLVAVSPRADRTGIAAFDLSAGKLRLCEAPGELHSDAVRDALNTFNPTEILVPDGISLQSAAQPDAVITTLPLAFFDLGRAGDRLEKVGGLAMVRTLGLETMPAAQSAAGALLAYAERCRLQLPSASLRVEISNLGNAAGTMRLDVPTRTHLELIAPLQAAGLSLFQILNLTATPMGARLLKQRILQPLTDPHAINARLDAVAHLAGDPSAHNAVTHALTGIADLERLITRCVQGIASPRELGAIRDTFLLLPSLQAALRDLPGELSGLSSQCSVPEDLSARLQALLVAEPPATSKEGGCIRPGADPELDRLRGESTDAREYLSGLETRERERTGIRSLKVGYNRVFGYYIEIPNAQRDGAPADYIRKQTLAGAERYLTAELKEKESIVLNAKEQIVAREQQLLHELREDVAAAVLELRQCTDAIAIADVAQALTAMARDHNWTRPVVDDSLVLAIENGRHPMIEKSLGRHRYVPNDAAFDAKLQIQILTGPNMAGKSTYLRQVATIVLLAQIGSFVPASRAHIGVCDRIFTRIGAQDDLSGGLSTFMVEMAETAAILRQATNRSLVVLDEIGRGTSTYDGLSIAQAVIEHIHHSPDLHCRTIFATHYHELTALEGILERVGNARVDVAENDGEITFLYKIVPGGADRSYGIHVAKLAGLPQSVLDRSWELLAALESKRPLAEEVAQLNLGFGDGR